MWLKCAPMTQSRVPWCHPRHLYAFATGVRRLESLLFSLPQPASHQSAASKRLLPALAVALIALLVLKLAAAPSLGGASYKAGTSGTAGRIVSSLAAGARNSSPPGWSVLSVESSALERRVTNVNLTFYDCLEQDFCGAMYNGRTVYEGAAACSWDLPLGTRFSIVGDPTGRVYTCEDRGLLADTWVDVFWHDPADGWRWQAEVGRHGAIVLLP